MLPSLINVDKLFLYSIVIYNKMFVSAEQKPQKSLPKEVSTENGFESENESSLIWIAGSVARYVKNIKTGSNEFIDENLIKFVKHMLVKLELGEDIEDILKFLKQVLKSGDLKIIYTILGKQ